jgi:hypothetical protein
MSRHVLPLLALASLVGASDDPGLLLGLGVQTGFSSSLEAQTTVVPHLPHPGRESSWGGSLSAGWRTPFWRLGATAGLDRFNTTADEVEARNLGSSLTLVTLQEDVPTVLLDRFSLVGEAGVSYPFAPLFSVVAIASLGRNWISPGAYWAPPQPGSVTEHNPGWLGGLQGGIEMVSGLVAFQTTLGWEHFTYSLTGSDGRGGPQSDDRFVFGFRIGPLFRFPSADGP